MVFLYPKELFQMTQRIIKTKNGKGKAEEPNSFPLTASSVQLPNQRAVFMEATGRNFEEFPRLKVYNVKIIDSLLPCSL